jgi:hypothetical protein
MARGTAPRWIACALALAACGALGWDDPASQGVRSLDRYDGRARLEDFTRDVRRREEVLQARRSGDPGAIPRLERIWRQQDALTDQRRDADKRAIEQSVEGTKPVLDREPGPPPGHVERDDASQEFRQKLEAIERHEQLERLEQQTHPAPP